MGGPGSARARDSAAVPRLTSSGSQRRRSWSSSGIGAPGGVDAGGQPGGLELEQRVEGQHLALRREQRRQQAGQPDRLVAQLGPGPVGTRRRDVPLVEHQVDDLEHRPEPLRHLRRRWQLERDALGGQGPLGSRDPLSRSRFRDQQSPRHLRGRQAAEQAQGQGDPRLRREDRVAGGEDQPEQVVADVVVQDVVHVTHLLPGTVEPSVGHRPTDLGELARIRAPSPDQVDGLVARGGDEPAGGVRRNPAGRPLLQGGDEGVLGDLLAEADVAEDAAGHGDDAGGLHPPHRLRGQPRVGSGHGAGGASKTCWTSASPSQPAQCSWCSRTNRVAHSIASSRERTS